MLIATLLTLATTVPVGCPEGGVAVVADGSLRADVAQAVQLSSPGPTAEGAQVCMAEALTGAGRELSLASGSSADLLILEGFIDGRRSFRQLLDLVDTPADGRSVVIAAALEDAARALAAAPSPADESEATSRESTERAEAWSALFVSTMAGAAGAAVYLVPSVVLVIVTSSQIYLNAVMNFGALGQAVAPAQNLASMAAGLGLFATPLLGGAAAVAGATAAALVFDDWLVATGAGIGTTLGTGLGMGAGASVAALGCLYLLAFGNRTPLPAPPPSLVFGAQLARPYLVLMAMSWLIYSSPVWAILGVGAGGVLGALGGRGLRTLLDDGEGTPTER